MKTASSLLTASLCVGAAASMSWADMGDFIPPPIDVEAFNLEVGNLGVQYFDGIYYVSARGQTVAVHQVWQFDASGAGIVGAEFEQHPDAQGTTWGYRDGATDGTFLYFGCESGLYRHDPAAPASPTIQVNGAPPSGVGCWRALTYDPDGDGGNGSFWTCSFDTPIIEVSMNGTLLTTFPNLDNWSLYGLTLDPVTGNLWGHHGIRPAGGHPPPEIWEIDKTTGRTTGVSWQSDAGVPGTPPDFPLNGGMTLVPGGALGSGDDYDLVALLQADSDSLVAFELYSGGPAIRYVDGPDYDPLVPVTDPTTHPWHEIKPNFCTWWDADAWVDNGNGELDECDYIQLTDGVQTDWWHVDFKTFTAIVEVVEGGPVEDYIYLEWATPPYAGPLGTWIEIHPNFNQTREVIDWIDNGNGILDACDWIVVDPGAEFLHVAGVGSDMTLAEGDPPSNCPEDINNDGVVDVLDLLAVLADWGGSGPADVNGDGVVDVLDLLAVLGAWGPC